ncbi:MAG: methylmalonyl Co-A mutase-associated GTPase MeaB [Nitrospirae bacterium]|nr:methylmalonyl Co-A mutase-associated GTPase MeaB [Candidatus Manganitrophaceae bacterium]
MTDRRTDRSASIRSILKGNVRAASQLLTLVQNQSSSARPILKALFPHTGKARLIGITGPAGAGKSTLINQLITAFREKKQSVGVLAVDPTSPFSGGALLGDRLRMQPHFLDRDVFIRSLATRGAWGGLSPALFEAIHVLDAMGKEIILIETVGVGQDEVEIARLADVVVLVLAPGMGDEVQMMKAGLLEIGDAVVVNKGDLKEARWLYHQLKETLSDRPLLRVIADRGEGIPALITEIEKQLETEPAPARRRGFVREELRTLLREHLGNVIDQVSFNEKEIESVLLRRRDPYRLIRSWIKRSGVKTFSSTP